MGSIPVGAKNKELFLDNVLGIVSLIDIEKYLMTEKLLRDSYDIITCPNGVLINNKAP